MDEPMLRKLHRKGLSCSAIAREMGVSRPTISRTAKKLGLSFERTKLIAATEARIADLAAFRVAEAEALARDAQRIREQLWRPYIAWSIGGRDNIFTSHELDQPDVPAQLSIMRAAQTAWATSMKLTEFSQGEPASGARSLLSDLAGALSAAAEALPPDDAPDADGHPEP